MAFYHFFQPQFQASDAVNWAASSDGASTNMERVPALPFPPSPPFTPKPWGGGFFDLPAELLTTDWELLDESLVLPTEDIEAMCRAMGVEPPDFSVMPHIPVDLEPTPAPMAYPTPYPTPPLVAETPSPPH